MAQVNEAKLKANYVLTNEPDIRHHCEYMQLCQDKSSVLDEEPTSDIATLIETLDKMKAVNLENKDQCDQVGKCVQQAMETYNQVSLSVMENLAAISKKVDALEKVKS